MISFSLAELPPPEVIESFAHEYELRDELDAAWSAKPVELLRASGGRTLLVLEDPGGEPLERLIGAPMEIETFLRLAISVTVALGGAHQRGLVHKDVRPANILVNCADGQARLTGFGIASKLPRQRRSIEPPKTFEGTLAYMAPEQTGRMNRPVDRRSDLYALGVTFYQMLTGALPFLADTPLEWVHCHIARKPTPPAEILKTIPKALSDIVMKLMAKTAEDRHQTAGGLEHDLRRSLAQWDAHGRIELLRPGEGDIPDQLRRPEKLYGRERETEVLFAAYDRIVAGGTAELVLIAGQAGVGKSALAQELRGAVTAAHGLFAAGKFDPLKRDIPYSTVAQALQGLVRTLLGKRDAELAAWRDALSQALGPNGRLMVELVPELELLIGPQPPTPELPPRDAQRRFHLVFGRLLSVFARPEHPLALFLDDLQWLDADTLDLLEAQLAQPDLKHLLLVGAYRDDEVASSHPLKRLAASRPAGKRIHEISLKPLGFDDVARIVADALQTEGVASLARLVHRKTAGNPFFVIQFLSALVEEGLLAFDRRAARWTWDLGRIRGKGFTDNLADLMSSKLLRLPLPTRTALQQLGCLGGSATIATLNLLQAGREREMHAVLRPAVRAGLLLREEGGYRFLHDRVREAAYALISDEGRAKAHLAIGRRLAKRISPAAIQENVFEIVGQLNRGAALIASSEERERLAELNLIAGRRAKSSSAYPSALNYFAAGDALLRRDARERRRDLAFALELNRAECEFLTGALAEAEARLAQLAGRVDGPSELATLTRLWVDLLMTLGRSDRAIEVGLERLRRFDVVWSAHPTKDEVREEFARLWARLGDRPIEALLDLPPMTDPAARATVDILTSLVTPALFTDENLRALVIGRMGNLCLEHGVSDASCYAYVAVGNVLALYFSDYKSGLRFARLGLRLADRPGMERLRARVYLAFGNLAKISTPDVRTGRPLALHAFHTAQQAGDLTYAAFSCNNLLTQLLAGGAPLADVQREAEIGLDFAREVRFSLVGDLIAAQLQLVRMLRGLTQAFGCFNDDAFNEEQFERHLDAEPRLGIAACMYWIRKLQGRVLAGDYAAAASAAAKAEGLIWMSAAVFERADYHFYAALALIAQSKSASAGERAECRSAVAAHQRRLEAWAETNPECFAQRVALIDAEIARQDGREIDAERHYERAISSARANGVVHDEALAHELAAQFYGERGLETIARAYLRNSRYCYERWGADGKARSLGQAHPQIDEGETVASARRATGAEIEQLDLATVIKVSQAVSSEIVVESLIDTVMRLAIEQAGADRGQLLLTRGEELEIAAEATVDGGDVTVRMRGVPASQGVLPQSVLNYVRRSRESLILDDAAADSPFAEDPHFRLRRPRSILCLPLLDQAKLTGVLYLENNLAPGVFAPARIAVLKLLASQAAVSLANTYLYRERQRDAEALRNLETQLEHASRLATMGQLTASIAHEVNQPIGATVANAQAALRWLNHPTPELEEARQALTRIVRDGMRASAVVARIRSLIKREPQQKERVAVNAAIQEIIEITHSEALRSGVSVRVELGDDLPNVFGDRVELQQVVLNLIVNSLQAMRDMKEGPREIVVTTAATETGDALVSVRDTGPGLPPEIRSNLFKPFHTTKATGFGLGLSICRSIVESHGGRLWASADDARGVTFHFTLSRRSEGDAD